MIDIATFKKLRMSQFINPAGINHLKDWEFQGHVNVGEAHGFSEWLRATKAPDELWSLSIAFDDFPETAQVLNALELPIMGGMGVGDLVRLFGPHQRTYSLVEDRRGYEFSIPQQTPDFILDCTVMHNGGLSYFVLMIASFLANPTFDQNAY